MLCTHHNRSAVDSTGWKPFSPGAMLLQPLHQPLEESALRVLVAIADTDAARVTPDLGGEKQKPQTRGRQGHML
jgi:hypothetical protein